MNDPVVQSLEVQIITAVLGVLGALVLYEVKRLIAAKHLQTQAQAVQSLAETTGWTLPHVVQAGSQILSRILGQHGVNVPAATIAADAQAAIVQAQADEKTAAAARAAQPATPQVVVVTPQASAPVAPAAPAEHAPTPPAPTA